MGRTRYYALLGLAVALAAVASANAALSIELVETHVNVTTCSDPRVTYIVQGSVQGVGNDTIPRVDIATTAGDKCVRSVNNNYITVMEEDPNGMANFTLNCTWTGADAFNIPLVVEVMAYEYNSSLAGSYDAAQGRVENFINATKTDWRPSLVNLKPAVSFASYLQTPAAAKLDNLDSNVTVKVGIKFDGVTAADNASRIIEPPYNCTLDAPENFDSPGYTDTIIYTCDFTRRTVPAQMTWAAYSNGSAGMCNQNYTWLRSTYLKDELDIIVDTPGADVAADVADQGEQLCGAATGAATYRVTLKVRGAINMTAGANCTLKSGALNATYGFAGYHNEAPLVYECTRPFDNATAATVMFVATGKFGAFNKTVTLPASRAAVQPAIEITSVEQTLATPRAHWATAAPTNITYAVTVKYTNAPSQAKIATQKPSQCVPVTNLTALTYPYTGDIQYTCGYDVALVTTNAAGVSSIAEDEFKFAVKTDAGGCYAKASRALGVVFEPAVSINITDVKQGCMPSAAGAVAYKVSVDYMGAKKEAASALAGCVKSSGALGVLGNGTLVWKCTFASADAAANVTLNFTAAGLIDGEARSASLALPATKIAVQPTVEITKLPTQASLLKFNDTASKVNFTVSAKFAGATAGLWKSEPKCVTAGNASAVRDATVTLDFVCSFDNSRQVPETFKFRSLTAADDCFAEDEENATVIYQDRVFAAPSAPAQRCLVSLADEVSYDVAVLFSGARKNRTFPAACKEDDIALDAKGTGAAAYVCKFANASLVAPLTFNAEGIVPGDVGAAATVAPPAAAIAGKPSLKVAPAVQDLIKAGSNQTWVAYTLNTESLGADLIRLLHANGTCALLPTTAAAKFPGFELPEGESLFKLTSVNVTTRLTFACNFTNTSTVPSAISVDAGLSTATGCMDSKDANISVVKAAADAFVPYVYSLHFGGMDYDEITKPAAADRLKAFKMAVRAKVAAAVALPIGNVEISKLAKGSVIAEVVLQTPSAWSPAQVNQAADLLTAAPADVFDAAFLDEYGITGVTVTVVSALPPVKKALSKEAAIGIGVGVGVGGLALIGGGVGIALARKRRSAVEPRDHMA